jgi:PPOX class probable F420-dependent enzyme
MFDATERRYLEAARVGRLATADADGRPTAVPVCFALDGEKFVTAVDEKPQAGDPRSLRRVRDVEANPRVALLVDHYVENWEHLGWVQVRGTVTVCEPGASSHGRAVDVLREKYDQYEDHALDERPTLRIDPGSVTSWGRLDSTSRGGSVTDRR